MSPGVCRARNNGKVGCMVRHIPKTRRAASLKKPTLPQTSLKPIRNCPRCKTLRKATKTLSLSRLPPVLLIHLKRFSFKGPFTDKIEKQVDFPLKNLDLTNYMLPPLPPGVDRTGTQTYPPEDPRLQIPPYRYDLYAVTNHFGSLSSGHCTSFFSFGLAFCQRIT
jgi:ubiquitin C-terminal hydrolase